MKLGTTIAVGILALIVGILMATILSVAFIIDRAARDDVDERLMRSRSVVGALNRDRQTRYRSETRVIAEEPRLKAAVATEDPHLPTITGVAQSMQKTTRSDLFLLLDADGDLLVDAVDPGRSDGGSLADRPLVRAAFDAGVAVGVWADERSAYMVQAQRMAFGAQVVGAVVVGHAIDDEVARSINAQTGSPAAVLLDGKVIAASGFPEDVTRDALAAQLGGVSPAAAAASVTIGGTEFLAVAGAYDEYDGERDLRYVVVENLEKALAPGRRVKLILYGILAAAVLAAVVFALTLSRRLSRPLAQLVGFTKAIASGDLKPRDASSGPDEVQHLAAAMNRMATELDESRAQVAEKHRLENELEIAQGIQTSIVPDSFDIPGLEIAARMTPASEVGGDYYDAIAVEDGGWIGIGDVAGHGLNSGLVMLMAQTSVSTLVEALPEASPRGLLISLNRVIYDNVQRRMRRNRHMTMSLMRYFSDGRLVIAGAHMELAILRAGATTAEEHVVPGTWIGMTQEIGHVTEDVEISLGVGDIVVLFTDGVTEALDPGGEMFGFGRLCKAIESCDERTAPNVLEAVFESVQSWQEAQDDDLSVVVLRHRGPNAAENAVS